MMWVAGYLALLTVVLVGWHAAVTRGKNQAALDRAVGNYLTDCCRNRSWQRLDHIAAEVLDHERPYTLERKARLVQRSLWRLCVMGLVEAQPRAVVYDVPSMRGFVYRATTPAKMSASLTDRGERDWIEWPS